MKRSQHGRFRRTGRLPMIDGIDEHGHTKDVREKDELLALLVADLTRPREEVDRGHPLRRGGLDFSDDRVQVRDHRRHDLPKAFAPALCQARDDNVCCVVFGEWLHRGVTQRVGDRARRHRVANESPLVPAAWGSNTDWQEPVRPRAQALLLACQSPEERPAPQVGERDRRQHSRHPSSRARSPRRAWHLPRRSH